MRFEYVTTRFSKPSPQNLMVGYLYVLAWYFIPLWRRYLLAICSQIIRFSCCYSCLLNTKFETLCYKYFRVLSVTLLLWANIFEKCVVILRIRMTFLKCLLFLLSDEPAIEYYCVSRSPYKFCISLAWSSSSNLIEQNDVW